MKMAQTRGKQSPKANVAMETFNEIATSTIMMVVPTYAHTPSKLLFPFVGLLQGFKCFYPRR